MTRPCAQVAVLASLGTAPGCGNDCGTYAYKGVLGTEWCGSVYGTEGTFFDGTDEVASAHLLFRHTVPPGEFDFEHTGEVRADLLWADLESGEPLGVDRVRAVCTWTDFGDPRFPTDDVVHLGVPATAVELRGRGRGFNLDPGDTRVRDLSWSVTCGDGVIRLDGRDVVAFDGLGRTEVLHADLQAFFADPQ